MALTNCTDPAIFMPEEQCDSCEQFQSDVDRLDQAVSSLSNRIDAVNTALSGKQNTLTFDTTPTDGSGNPVTSDGVYDRFTKSDGNLAPIETNPATGAHAVGDWIMVDGSLYRVTAAISVGDALTVGGNVEKTEVLTGFKQRQPLLATRNFALTQQTIQPNTQYQWTEAPVAVQGYEPIAVVGFWTGINSSMHTVYLCTLQTNMDVHFGIRNEADVAVTFRPTIWVLYSATE